jgi:hypothetical protein
MIGCAPRILLKRQNRLAIPWKLAESTHDLLEIDSRSFGIDSDQIWRDSQGEAWWARQDSNLQPDRYERPALTIELQAPPHASRATVPPPFTGTMANGQCRGPFRRFAVGAPQAPGLTGDPTGKSRRRLMAVPWRSGARQRVAPMRQVHGFSVDF